MNGRKAMDAPDFLVPKDQQTELEMAEWAAEMAIRDRDVLRKAIAYVAPEDYLPSGLAWHTFAACGVDPCRGPLFHAEDARKANSGDSSPITGRCRAVLDVLGDGQWKSTVELCGPKTGSEGLRRLRELRSKGFVIVKRRKKDSTQYEYRLVK